MLREGQTLGAKMVSLAGMQNTLDFLSTLIRNRELEDADLQLVHGFLRPFTREESDIGEAFLSETRIGLLSGIPPVAMSSSWATRLVLQENATFNEEYRVTVVPIRLRAALSAGEFYDQEGFKPLKYELRAVPHTLYNFGGRLAQSRSAWEPQEFISRVHDENGRISLVLLQAEIKQSRVPDFEAVLRSSTHRNPYTNEPMKYDARAHTISFKCLHAAFHPPDPPDVCSVAIAR